LEKQASVLEQDSFGKTAAQQLGEMKPAPKLYALLKRAIKRESLRNKLQVRGLRLGVQAGGKEAAGLRRQR